MAQAQVLRPQRGERLASFYPPVPEPVPSVFNIESAFQLQEYISLLIRLDVHDVEAITSLPGSSGSHAKEGSEEGRDKGKGKEKERAGKSKQEEDQEFLMK